MPPADTGLGDAANNAKTSSAAAGRTLRSRGKLAGLTAEQRVNATLGSKPRRKSRRESNWGLPREYDKDLVLADRKSASIRSSSWFPQASQTRGSLLSRASSRLSLRFSSMKNRLTRSSSNLTQISQPDSDSGPAVVDAADMAEPTGEHADLPQSQEIELPCVPEPEEEHSEGEQQAREKVLLENLVDAVDEESSEYSQGGPRTIGQYREELMRCIHYQQVDRIRQLVGTAHICNAKYPQIPVDIPGQNGETPAVYAARNGLCKSCSCLLDLGADPLARDTHPNYFADGIGVWPDERQPDARGQATSMNPRAKAGRTIVYYLRLHGVLETTLSEVWPTTRVRVMRAIAHALQEFHQQPPLMVAAMEGHVKLAAMLLTHIVALPITSTPIPAPPEGSPPMLGTASHVGISDGSLATEPVEKKNIMLNDRGEALLAACSRQNWRVALVILGAGVARSNIDVAKDRLGRTSLHLAATGGQERHVKMLLEAGASPNAWSKWGRQPLHDAVAAGHTNIAVALVENGASLHTCVGAWGADGKFSKQVNAGGDMGKNSLEIARDCGYDLLHERLVQTAASEPFCSHRMF